MAYMVLKNTAQFGRGEGDRPALDCIQNLESGAVFLADSANPDYQAYLEWVAQGGVPEPAPEPEPVPELTPAEKLAAAGLTVEDLRALLAEG